MGSNPPPKKNSVCVTASNIFVYIVCICTHKHVTNILIFNNIVAKLKLNTGNHIMILQLM